MWIYLPPYNLADWKSIISNLFIYYTNIKIFFSFPSNFWDWKVTCRILFPQNWKGIAGYLESWKHPRVFKHIYIFTVWLHSQILIIISFFLMRGETKKLPWSKQNTKEISLKVFPLMSLNVWYWCCITYNSYMTVAFLTCSQSWVGQRKFTHSLL